MTQFHYYYLSVRLLRDFFCKLIITKNFFELLYNSFTFKVNGVYIIYLYQCTIIFRVVSFSLGVIKDHKIKAQNMQDFLCAFMMIESLCLVERTQLLWQKKLFICVVFATTLGWICVVIKRLSNLEVWQKWKQLVKVKLFNVCLKHTTVLSKFQKEGF